MAKKEPMDRDTFERLVKSVGGPDLIRVTEDGNLEIGATSKEEAERLSKLVKAQLPKELIEDVIIVPSTTSTPRMGTTENEARTRTFDWGAMESFFDGDEEEVGRSFFNWLLALEEYKPKHDRKWSNKELIEIAGKLTKNFTYEVSPKDLRDWRKYTFLQDNPLFAEFVLKGLRSKVRALNWSEHQTLCVIGTALKVIYLQEDAVEKGFHFLDLMEWGSVLTQDYMVQRPVPWSNITPKIAKLLIKEPTLQKPVHPDLEMTTAMFMGEALFLGHLDTIAAVIDGFVLRNSGEAHDDILYDYEGAFYADRSWAYGSISAWLKTGRMVVDISRPSLDALRELHIDRIENGESPIRYADLPQPGHPLYKKNIMFRFPQIGESLTETDPHGLQSLTGICNLDGPNTGLAYTSVCSHGTLMDEKATMVQWMRSGQLGYSSFGLEREWAKVWQWEDYKSMVENATVKPLDEALLPEYEKAVRLKENLAKLAKVMREGQKNKEIESLEFYWIAANALAAMASNVETIRS